MRFTHWIAVAAISSGLVAAHARSAQPEMPIYKDPRQPVEKRVDDLLARMTIEEKVAQLETIWEDKAKVQTPDGRFSPELASKNFPNGIGGFARPSDYRGVAQSNGAAGASGQALNRDALNSRLEEAQWRTQPKKTPTGKCLSSGSSTTSMT